jgi:hypothetical protein
VLRRRSSRARGSVVGSVTVNLKGPASAKCENDFTPAFGTSWRSVDKKAIASGKLVGDSKCGGATLGTSEKSAKFEARKLRGAITRICWAHPPTPARLALITSAESSNHEPC